MGSTLQQGVSVGVGVLALAVAAILWALVRGKTRQPRVESWIDRAIIILVLAGGVGLTGTWVGRWTRAGVGWVNGLASRWVGPAIGPWLLGAVALALAVAVVMSLFTANIGKRTLSVTWLTPFTAGAIPGPVGAGVITGITALTGLVAAGFGGLFGIG